MDEEFRRLRANAHAAFRRYVAGLATREEWLAEAQKAADYYNARAAEAARRLGVKPRLIKPERFKR